MVILGGKILCQYFIAHGGKSGKTVIFDQLQDLSGMVAQRFTTLVDVFRVKETLQNHGFSNNAPSVLRYVTLIVC